MNWQVLGSMGWLILIVMIVICLIAFIFHSVGTFFKDNGDGNGYTPTGKEKNIEQKLDRIIELLEKEKE
ncbi:DUF4083 domain-containing protein [Gracilibacillus caseinilyticus]|uniref:DUF4083 domain-containing protein n=1 Tax=Gracilibacillus caseinilyticus TaxID=2932256 RepID=A0ABY4F0A4_9BACI|nr:DUF4083 domain-containing protein [Gracilibacillus caseinilyticus]UOQ50092.1 DUF4083 domain-containing protein [Gracilibacillus caseinilyticus]